MHEEAPPPIVRTRSVFFQIIFFFEFNKGLILIRVIKVDRPLRSGYSQPGSPYGHPYNGLPSFSNGCMGGSNAYRNHSIVGSVGRPVAYHNAVDNNPSFSSASSFEYAPQTPMAPTVQPPTMMMMPTAQQMQPMGVMQQQQQQQPVQQQMMYRPVQMQSSMPQMAPQSVPQFPSTYIPQNYMYPTHQGMSFGYRPMMQQGRMIPSGMPMMAAGNTLAAPGNNFPSQPPMFNPLAQQLVY
jgi:hypothetical protein